ncbi:hypothetical protein BDQ17DRAFT_1335969 [Cyathus striatus]|nr:hypothetical protein BDQ17DRAFT_1335969 [Cyathus striatus]
MPPGTAPTSTGAGYSTAYVIGDRSSGHYHHAIKRGCHFKDARCLEIKKWERRRGNKRMRRELRSFVWQLEQRNESPVLTNVDLKSGLRYCCVIAASGAMHECRRWKEFEGERENKREQHVDARTSELHNEMVEIAEIVTRRERADLTKEKENFGSEREP